MEINLSGQNLSAVPESVYQTRVEILRLTNNRLVELDGTRLPYVRLLYLDGNDLTTIPSGVFCLPALEILVLSKNRIHTIPSAIQTCRKLKALYLYENQLTGLPDALFTLPRLGELYLNSNLLKEIPPGIQGLTRLTDLILSNNPLQTVPWHLKALPNLKCLWFQNSAFGDAARVILNSIRPVQGVQGVLSFTPDECHICMETYDALIQLPCFATHRVCSECYSHLSKCPFCCRPLLAVK